MMRRPPRSTLFPSRRSSDLGCIRWFWEVFKWDGTKWVAGGDDSEAAVAFLPANDAFCHIKDAMRRLEAKGDRKSTRLNSSHVEISYAVFCLKKKKKINKYTV